MYRLILFNPTNRPTKAPSRRRRPTQGMTAQLRRVHRNADQPDIATSIPTADAGG